jgi:hypothetical protein
MYQQPVLTEWNHLTGTLVQGIDSCVFKMFNLPLSATYLDMEDGHALDFVHILRQFERDLHKLRAMCIPISNDLYRRQYNQHCKLDLSPMSCGRNFINYAQQQGWEPTLLTAVSQLKECLEDPAIRSTAENIQYLILVAGACLPLTYCFRATRGIPKITIDIDDLDHEELGRARRISFAAAAAYRSRWYRKREDRKREREERERRREREERERQERRPRPQESRVQNVVILNPANNVTACCVQAAIF